MSDTRIDSLGLEARFVNPLTRAGIVTLERAASLDLTTLISCRGVGPETIRVLRFELDRLGIPHQLPRKNFTIRYD